MANIDRIVNVQIALNTTGISKEGFSTLLVVGAHAHSLARVETYTSTDGMIDAGYNSDEAIYKAVADAFSQTPRPRIVKVGRRLCDDVRIGLKKVLSAGTYTITINTKDVDGVVDKKDYSYTNSGGSEDDILDGIVAAVTDPNVTASKSGREVVISAASGVDFAVVPGNNLTMMAGTVTETIAETMAAIKKSDNDFYGIALASRRPEDILAMAEWTETDRKIFGCSIAEPGAKDSEVVTDTGYKLMNNNFYRTFWFYHADAATDYPETAVMARCFAIDPGGETWANKKLAAVTVDPLTETEFIAIRGKNGNTFERFRNVSITQNGKVAAGEWIDVIRFRDWLQEEITVNVFDALINNDKIPYTDAGIAIIENRIRQALDAGQRSGGIAPTEYDEDGRANLGYTVSVPLNANISTTDHASRILKEVSFTARLAGAIHVVEIKGGLTYENLIEG